MVVTFWGWDKSELRGRFGLEKVAGYCLVPKSDVYSSLAFLSTRHGNYVSCRSHASKGKAYDECIGKEIYATDRSLAKEDVLRSSYYENAAVVVVVGIMCCVQTYVSSTNCMRTDPTPY